jgi:hypothetical protein
MVPFTQTELFDVFANYHLLRAGGTNSCRQNGGGIMRRHKLRIACIAVVMPATAIPTETVRLDQCGCRKKAAIPT